MVQLINFPSFFIVYLSEQANICQIGYNIMFDINRIRYFQLTKKRKFNSNFGFNSLSIISFLVF